MFPAAWLFSATNETQSRINERTKGNGRIRHQTGDIILVLKVQNRFIT